MSARDSFITAYITAALWSSAYGDNGEYNLDDGKHNLAPETESLMRAESGAFFDTHEELIASCEHSPNIDHAGHDFWLTRNGHGAGYWDGDWPEPQAALLTTASKAAGSRDLYVGDDGLIYQF